jgi:hypothetical protein
MSGHALWAFGLWSEADHQMDQHPLSRLVFPNMCYVARYLLYEGLNKEL